MVMNLTVNKTRKIYDLNNAFVSEKIIGKCRYYQLGSSLKISLINMVLYLKKLWSHNWNNVFIKFQIFNFLFSFEIDTIC